MTGAADQSLRQAVASLSQPGLLLDCRLIAPGDERALLDEESESMPSRVASARRASGAARIVGRQLLAQLGFAPCAILKGPSGAPLWPAGITGSFAHDDTMAVAAVGLSSAVGAAGIDIEPATMLPADMLELVATPRERAGIGGHACGGRLLFAAKEAVYKSIHPLDHMFLEYHDIEIDLAAREAVVRNGRVVAIRFCISSHLVVLALT